MTRITIGFVAQLAFALVSLTAFAQARGFSIQDNGGSRAQFVSDAPLETITGVTSKVRGALRFNPTNLAAVQGRVEVDADSIRTGIDLRDEHLRSPNWLDAARFSKIEFTLTRVEGATALRPNENTRVKLIGTIKIHGVERPIEANARLRFMPLTEEMRAAMITADVLLIQARFQIKLSDFGINIPDPVKLKLANELDVRVALRATADTAATH